MLDINNVFFILSIVFLIYSFRIAYLIGFKKRLDLLYSIDQVKMLHKDTSKKSRIATGIAIVYIISGIGFVINYYNAF